ncbi:MAG: hypothetical protein ACO3RC_05150 [Candidatus Nanopelagicaceae bacterium]
MKRRSTRLLIASITSLVMALFALPSYGTEEEGNAVLGIESITKKIDILDFKFDSDLSDYDIFKNLLLDVLASKPKSAAWALADGNVALTAFIPTDRAFRKLVKSLTGVYSIQFSAQLIKGSNGTDPLDVWLGLNGQNVTWSNTQLQFTKGQRQVAAWNFVIALNGGDYVELYWSSPDSTFELVAAPSQINPARPAVPSLIVTVTQVS